MRYDGTEKRTTDPRKPGMPAWLSALAIAALSFPVPSIATDDTPKERSNGQSEWTSFIRGGYVHQFNSDLDGGGDFSVGRSFLQGGVTYSMGPRRRVSFSVGGGRDRYDFSGGLGLVDKPWGRIDQLRFSIPITWSLDERWTLFAIPTLRYYGESGANWSDSATGGALAGVSYRVGDKLTIGPGVGVLSRLEDSVNVFPILLIDWKITDRLSLETGRGLGATQGPGLDLGYRLSESWTIGLGARYESLRFRLDDRGSAPNGVGEDRSIPVYSSVTYSRGRDLRISAIAGANFDSELRLEDSRGRRLARDGYEPAPFLGATFNIQF